MPFSFSPKLEVRLSTNYSLFKLTAFSLIIILLTKGRVAESGKNIVLTKFDLCSFV